VSVSRYVDVWCDVCGNWEAGATSPTADRARIAARRVGWRIGLPGGMDVCPRCIAKGLEPIVPCGHPDWEYRS